MRSLIQQVPVSRCVQIFLLEQEKQRLLLASDKVDGSMRGYRERINNGRLDSLAKNRVFDGLRTQLEAIKADLIVKIEHSNEIMDEKEQVVCAGFGCCWFCWICLLLCLSCGCSQLDKVRDSKVRESEDSVIDFESRYQALTQELVELQESYKSESCLAVVCFHVCFRHSFF